MRIVQIHVYNLLTFDKLTLDVPAEGYTVVRGESDSGKSNLLRALRWCLFDDGHWKSMMRDPEQEAVVRVEFEDGYVLERRRRGASKSSGKYVVMLPGYKPDEYGKPSAAWREVIAPKVLGLPLDEDLELLDYGQFDALFMVGDTGPKLAERLMGMAGPEVRQAERNTREDARLWAKRIDTQTLELAQWARRQKVYDEAEGSLPPLLSGLVAKEQMLSEFERMFFQIEPLLIELADTLKELVDEAAVASVLAEFDQAAVAGGLQEVEASLRTLTALEALEDVSWRLRQLPDADDVGLPSAFDGQLGYVETVADLLRRLSDVEVGLERTAIETVKLTGEQTALDAEWEEIQGGVCPLCSQPLEGVDLSGLGGSQ